MSRIISCVVAAVTAPILLTASALTTNLGRLNPRVDNAVTIARAARHRSDSVGLTGGRRRAQPLSVCSPGGS